MYKTINGKRQCSTVTIPGGCRLALEFNFDRPPYDDKVRDGWACKSFDFDKEIEVFQASGYSDSEIEALYERLHKAALDAPMSRNGLGCLDVRFTLPKPVMVEISYQVYADPFDRKLLRRDGW